MSSQMAKWSRAAMSPKGLTVALLVLIVGFFFLIGLSFSSLFFLYLLFAVATFLVVRSVPVEPGVVLGRRSVRRGLVGIIVLICAGLMASPSQGVSALVSLLLLLVVCDVLLGRATRRIASASDARVDERQEALRNRAHRLAYGVLAVGAGGTVLIAYVAGSNTRGWLADALNGGPIWVFLQLLFFLPAMTLAWLESDRLAADDVPAPPGSRRARLAMGMVAASLLIPIVLALTLVLIPVRTSSFQRLDFTDGTSSCKYFDARKQVGLGFGATQRLSAVACWDGNKAYEEWEMNASDCLGGDTAMAYVTATRCSRSTDAGGTLRFVYAAHVQSAVLPFLSRDVVVTLAVARDGRVVQFP